MVTIKMGMKQKKLVKTAHIWFNLPATKSNAHVAELVDALVSGSSE